MKTIRPQAFRPSLTGYTVFLLILVLFASCYSVRVVSRDAIYSQVTPHGNGFYADKELHKLDTVIRSKAWQQFWMQEKPCGDCGFYSMEYRNSIGGSLLYFFTLGSRRKIRITYVCATK
jgi:hypothetical protein